MAKILVTAGASSDLMGTNRARDILLDYIIDNWDAGFSPNMPAVDTVKWRTWWTGTPGLHVAATEIINQVQIQALGLMPGLIAYRSLVVLDMFDMSMQWVYPPGLAAASAFIEQLVQTNEDGLKGSGIQQMQLFRTMELKEQDPASNVFHHSIDVQLIYAKAAVVV